MKPFFLLSAVLSIFFLATGCGMDKEPEYQKGILGTWQAIGFQDGSNFIQSPTAQKIRMTIDKNSIVASLRCLSGTIQGVVPIEINKGKLNVLNATEMASNGSDKDCYIGFVQGQSNFEIVNSHLKISPLDAPHSSTLWQKIN